MKSVAELDRLLAMMEVSLEAVERLDPLIRHEQPAAPPDYVSIFYVTAGIVDVTIPRRSARRCGAGMTVLLPPGLSSAFQEIADGEQPALIAGLARVRLSGAGLLDRVRVPIFADLGDTPIAGHTMAELARIAGRSDAPLATSALSGSLAKTCILLVLQDFFSRPGIDLKMISALADERLATVIAAVLERPGDAHSLTSMAALAGLSRTTFSRLFGEAMGQPPTEFVAKTRLYYAAELLRTGNAPVKAVAGSVGFSSRSHFSRAFRDAYGMDPTAYRQHHACPAEAPRPQDLRQITVA